MTDPTTLLARLLADPPPLHGGTTHGLVDEALAWIAARPRPERTLETGCGLSTVVFAARGDDHLCITPAVDETERVREYCVERGIATDGLSFRTARSEDVLPGLEPGPLDLVLIDGSHAFPQVFIDFFYATRHLRVGGVLVVDDVHLWTGRVLRDFLAAEPSWRAEEEWAGRTVAFVKAGEPEGLDWFDQPYVLSRSTPTRARARIAASLVRRGDLRTLVGYVRRFRG